jgi:hypothetical protein
MGYLVAKGSRGTFTKYHVPAPTRNEPAHDQVAARQRCHFFPGQRPHNVDTYYQIGP